MTTPPQTSESNSAETKKSPKNFFGLTFKAEVSVPALEKTVDKLPSIPIDFFMITVGYILVSALLSVASILFENPPGKNAMLILIISTSIYAVGLLINYFLSLWKRFKS